MRLCPFYFNDLKSWDWRYKYTLTQSLVKAADIGSKEIFEYKITNLFNGTQETAKLEIRIDSYNTIVKSDSDTDIVLEGSDSDEVLVGNAFNNIITSKGGSDLLLYKLLDDASHLGGNGQDIWTDFKVGQVYTDSLKLESLTNPTIFKTDGADAIDISALLDDSATKLNIAQYIDVKYDASTKSAMISIDRDGKAGVEFESTKLLTLTNQDKVITLEELLNNNQIIF